MNKFLCILRNFIVDMRHVVYRDIARLPFIRRIDNNKLYATGFFGMKYGDNPAYILEKVKELRPQTRIIWPKHHGAEFDVPPYVETVRENSFAYFYHMLTAKVLVNSHDWSKYYVKDKRQFLLNTWHGGLGIKKVAGDCPINTKKYSYKHIKNKIGFSDLLISQSEHLSKIYRNAFYFDGPIWNCGYPKTDILFGDREPKREELHRQLGKSPEVKFLLYAPTFRDYLAENSFKQSGIWPYNLDFLRLKTSMEKRFGGNWCILVRKHPAMDDSFNAGYSAASVGTGDYVDVTSLSEVQKLLMGCDACVSDYSSIIFDAALLNIPCFTYANDEDFCARERGMYYHLNELPFPTAKDNDEIEQRIVEFDDKEYYRKLACFMDKIAGLHETGHATEDIARLICNVLDGRNTEIHDLSMTF